MHYLWLQFIHTYSHTLIQYGKHKQCTHNMPKQRKSKDTPPLSISACKIQASRRWSVNIERDPHKMLVYLWEILFLQQKFHFTYWRVQCWSKVRAHVYGGWAENNKRSARRASDINILQRHAAQLAELLPRVNSTASSRQPWIEEKNTAHMPAWPPLNLSRALEFYDFILSGCRRLNFPPFLATGSFSHHRV